MLFCLLWTNPLQFNLFALHFTHKTHAPHEQCLALVFDQMQKEFHRFNCDSCNSQFTFKAISKFVFVHLYEWKTTTLHMCMCAYVNNSLLKKRIQLWKTTNCMMKILGLALAKCIHKSASIAIVTVIAIAIAIVFVFIFVALGYVMCAPQISNIICCAINMCTNGNEIQSVVLIILVSMSLQFLFSIAYSVNCVHFKVFIFFQHRKYKSFRFPCWTLPSAIEKTRNKDTTCTIFGEFLNLAEASVNLHVVTIAISILHTDLHIALCKQFGMRNRTELWMDSLAAALLHQIKILLKYMKGVTKLPHCGHFVHPLKNLIYYDAISQSRMKFT